MIPDCCTDVGVASTSVVPDTQITATSHYSPKYVSHYGHLHETRGKGCALKEYSINQWKGYSLPEADREGQSVY